MKIGVLSDTHIPIRAATIPPKVLELLQGVDKIIHAGDIEDPNVLDELGAIAPVTAVAGNMDTSIYGLPVKRSLKIGQIKIGIMHGAGGPRNNIRPFIQRHLGPHDIIVYGHTHQAFWQEDAGTWYMNPGSPTDTIGADYQSIGMINIEDNKFSGKLIKL